MRRSKRAVPALAAILAIGAIGAVGVGCGGDDDEDSSVNAYCDKIKELEGQPSPLENLSGGDIESVKEGIAKYQDLIGQVASVAPSEISGDVETVQDTVNTLGDGIRDAETPQQLLQAAQQFQSEAAGVQEASQRLTDYTEENCGTGGDTTG